MSLRKVSSGRIEKSGFWMFTNWKFFTAKTRYFSLTSSEHRQAAKKLKAAGAARIGREDERVLWWTSSGLFWADPELSDEDVELLVWDRQRRQDSRLDRLRTRSLPAQSGLVSQPGNQRPRSTRCAAGRAQD